MTRSIAVDAQMSHFIPLLEELTDEMSIREIVYEKLEEELVAFGEHAANMRVHLSQWSRMAVEKIREIVLHVIEVISSGNWLLLRSDDAIDRARATFYVSDFDAAHDVECLDDMLNSEIHENLQGINELPVVKKTVTTIIKSLPEKLKSFIRSYRSKKAYSEVYEVQWVREWKDDVLSPSSAEIRSYEDAIEEMMTYDDSLSRLGALQTACDYVENAIMDNDWGSLYLKHRENLRELLNAISSKRGNGQGRQLDELRLLAKKYEWLIKEMENGENQEDDGYQHTAFHKIIQNVDEQTIMAELHRRITPSTDPSVIGCTLKYCHSVRNWFIKTPTKEEFEEEFPECKQNWNTIKSYFNERNKEKVSAISIVI